MIEEVWYKNGRNGKMVLPYRLRIPEKTLAKRLRTLLLREGYRCVSWNGEYPGFLVNVKWKRFGQIHRPCKFSGVDDRTYTFEEFLTEILWNAPTKRKRLAREKLLLRLLRAYDKLAVRFASIRNRKKNKKIREYYERIHKELGKVRSREDFVRFYREETLREYKNLTPERVDRAIEEYDGLREEYEQFVKTGQVNSGGIIWCIMMQA